MEPGANLYELRSAIIVAAAEHTAPLRVVAAYAVRLERHNQKDCLADLAMVSTCCCLPRSVALLL